MTTQAEALKIAQATLESIAGNSVSTMLAHEASEALRRIRALATVSSEAQPVAQLQRLLEEAKRVAHNTIHDAIEPINLCEQVKASVRDALDEIDLEEFASPAPDVRPSVLSDEQILQLAGDYSYSQGPTPLRVFSHDQRLLKFVRALLATQPASVQEVSEQPTGAEIHDYAEKAGFFVDSFRIAHGIYTKDRHNVTDEVYALVHALWNRATPASQPAAPVQQEPVDGESEGRRLFQADLQQITTPLMAEILDMGAAAPAVQAAPSVPDGLTEIERLAKIIFRKAGEACEWGYEHAGKDKTPDGLLEDIAERANSISRIAAAPAAPSVSADPLQELADEAQELDMGYGQDACPTCLRSGSGDAKDSDFYRGVIAALGALRPHGIHGGTYHDEIVRSVGKEQLYAIAEPEDVEWAGLDPEFYAAIAAQSKGPTND